MPLSKRQKRRLLEVSKMIESSIVVKDDMEEIQLEYAQEIEGVVDQIVALGSPPESENTISVESSSPVVSKTMKNVEKARKRRKRIKEMKEAREHVPPPKPEMPEAPEWAKRLWKAIAKKCHPDRLSFQELSALQIARRQIWFLEAKKLFEERSWPMLIHIGVQVSEYVEDVSHREQLKWLSGEYDVITKCIHETQSSLAWKWGSNWENLELRVNIVNAVLRHKGIEGPPKEKLIEILLNLEVD